jgi:hypothetical protein
VAPQVFKTGLFGESVKIANKTLGSSRPHRYPTWLLEANLGHKNVNSAPALAMPLRLVASDVVDGARARRNVFSLPGGR